MIITFWMIKQVKKPSTWASFDFWALSNQSSYFCMSNHASRFGLKHLTNITFMKSWFGTNSLVGKCADITPLRYGHPKFEISSSNPGLRTIGKWDWEIPLSSLPLRFWSALHCHNIKRQNTSNKTSQCLYMILGHYRVLFPYEDVHN